MSPNHVSDAVDNSSSVAAAPLDELYGYFGDSSDGTSAHDDASILSTMEEEDETIMVNPNILAATNTLVAANTIDQEEAASMIDEVGAHNYLVNFNGGSLNKPGAKSTRAKRESMMRIWNSFAGSVKRSEWLDKPAFVESGKIDFSIAECFLSYYVISLGDHAEKSQIKKCLDFMQYWVTTSLGESRHPNQKGAIRGYSLFKNIEKNASTTKAKRTDEDQEDMQVDLLVAVEPEQKSQFIDMCYLATCEKVSAIRPLGRQQVALGFTVGFQTGQRSEHMRANRYKMSLTRKMCQLGPGLGTEVDHMITNGGKSNANGNLECRALAPHKNPILDGSAHMGLNSLLRHTVLEEPFPSFLDFESEENSYCHRYLLRRMHDWTKAVDADSFRRQWSAVNTACGIFTGKITHQPRRQMQQDMLDKGVSEGNTQRMGYYASSNQEKNMNSSQKQSYVNNPPVQGVCAAADGDPHNTKDHCPVWSTVEVSEELVFEVAPYVGEQCRAVQAKWEELSTTKNPFEDRRKNRLFMAKGALKSIVLRIKRALQLAACHPYDAEGNLCMDGPPFYLRWRNFILFKNSFFSCTEFLDLVARMETTQVQAATFDVAVTSEVSNEIERVIQNNVNPQFAQVSTVLNSMLVSQQNLASVMRGMEERIVNKVVQALTLQRVGCQVPAVAEVSVASDVGDDGVDFYMDSSRPAPHNNDPPPQDTTNKTLTKKGKLRKKAPKINVLDCLPPGTFTWSRQLRKARDFWVEFAYGLPSSRKPPLCQLEDAEGSKWRSDKLISNVTGKKSTALKQGWSARTPIYNWILYRTLDCNMDEDAAIEEIQAVFDMVDANGRPEHYSRNGVPDLKKIAKRIRSMIQDQGAPIRYGFR